MLQIKVIPNSSPCCKLPPAKVFDSTSKQLVDEPKVIIDPKIDYRSMSIEVQLENGTLDDRMDFSSYGCSKLEMSDRVTKVASEINETLDKVDLEKKREEEIKQLLDEVYN